MREGECAVAARTISVGREEHEGWATACTRYVGSGGEVAFMLIRVADFRQ